MITQLILVVTTCFAACNGQHQSTQTVLVYTAATPSVHMSSSNFFIGNNGPQNTQMPTSNTIQSSAFQQWYTSISPYSGTSTGGNNLQPSVSQVWPANSPQSSSYNVPSAVPISITQLWPIHTQMPLQPSSSQGMTNMQGSVSQVFPMNSQYQTLSMQTSQQWPVNSHIFLQSSSGYLAPGTSMHPTNTQISQHLSTSTGVNNVQPSLLQMVTLHPQQSSYNNVASSIPMHTAHVWSMNTQMPLQASSSQSIGNMQPSVTHVPINLQTQSVSLQITQHLPVTSQILPQSSTGHLVPGSSTQPMNTQISQYLGTSSGFSNVQPSVSQIWPANPPQSSSNNVASSVPMHTAQVSSLNTQMPLQPSSFQTMTNMQQSVSHIWPANPQSSSNNIASSVNMQSAHVWSMNTQIPLQPSSSQTMTNMQQSVSNIWPHNPQSSTNYIASSVNMHTAHVWSMNTQMPLQPSSFQTVTNMLPSLSQVVPINLQTQSVSVQITQQWPVNSQILQQSSTGHLVPGSSTQPMNTQMSQYLGTSSGVNNVQPSVSQIWPANPPQSSSNDVASSVSMHTAHVWSLNTHMPLQPSSSQTMTNMQQSVSHIWPQNPQSSTNYIASSVNMHTAHVWSMNTQMPLQPSSSQTVTNMQQSLSQVVPINLQTQSVSVQITQQWPVNSQILQQSSTGHLVPGSSTQPMNTQMSQYLGTSSGVNNVQPSVSQIWPANPPQSSSNNVASSVPMHTAHVWSLNTQMPLQPSSSQTMTNMQQSVSHIWPANPQSSSNYIASSVNMQSAHVWSMNTQIPLQPSSSQSMGNMQPSLSQAVPINLQTQSVSVQKTQQWPVNSQILQQSSTGHLVPVSSTQPMNTQMSQYLGTSSGVNNVQPSVSQIWPANPPQSSSNNVASSVPMHTAQVSLMNTQMPLQPSSFQTMTNMQQSVSHIWPANPQSSSNNIASSVNMQSAHVWSMNTQIPLQPISSQTMTNMQPSLSQVVPINLQTQSVSVQITQHLSVTSQILPQSSTGHLVPGSSTQPMNTQISQYLGTSSGFSNVQPSVSQIWPANPPQSSNNVASTVPMHTAHVWSLNTQMPVQPSSFQTMTNMQQSLSHIWPANPQSSSNNIASSVNMQSAHVWSMNTQIPLQPSSSQTMTNMQSSLSQVVPLNLQTQSVSVQITQHLPVTSQILPQSSTDHLVPGSSTLPMNNQMSQYLGTSSGVSNVQPSVSQIWPANPPQSSSNNVAWSVPMHTAHVWSTNTQMPLQPSSSQSIGNMQPSVSHVVPITLQTQSVSVQITQQWPVNSQILQQSSTGHLVPGSSTQPMNTQMSQYLGTSSGVNNVQPSVSQIWPANPPQSSSNNIASSVNMQSAHVWSMNTQIPLQPSSSQTMTNMQQSVSHIWPQNPQSSTNYIASSVNMHTAHVWSMNTQMPLQPSAFQTVTNMQPSLSQVVPINLQTQSVSVQITQQWPVNSQILQQSSTGHLVPGSSTQPMNTQMSQYLGTSSGVNNVQPSVSQIWPANPPQSSSNNIASSVNMQSTHVWSMNTQIPLQPSSSQTMTNMQQSVSHIWPQNPQSSTNYIASSVNMHTAHVWSMNTQMPLQPSSSQTVTNMQPSLSQVVPINLQTQSVSVQITQQWPVNSQILQQSSTGHLVPGSSTQPMNTQMSQYLGTSSGVNNVQPSVSQIWPANPPQSSSNNVASSVPMQTAHVGSLNTQMSLQPSSSLTNMQPSVSQVLPINSQYLSLSMQISQQWPVTSQILPHSSSGYLVTGSSTQPMNTQMSQYLSTSTGVYSVQQSISQIWPSNPPQSSSNNLASSINMHTSQVVSMNTHMPLQPSSSQTMTNMQPSVSQVVPINSQYQSLSIQISQQWPVTSQILPHSSSGYLAPVSYTQPMNTQMSQYLSTSTGVNSVQQSVSQIWHTNPPQSSSNNVVSSVPMHTANVWSMNTQISLQLSSSQTMTNMQPSLSHVLPLNSQSQSLSMQISHQWPVTSQVLPNFSSGYLSPSTYAQSTQIWPPASQVLPQASTTTGVNNIQSSAQSNTILHQQITSSPVQTSVQHTPVASATPVVGMTTQQVTTSHLSYSTQQITTQSATGTSSISPSSSASNAQSSQSAPLSGNLGSGGTSVWSYCSWKMLIFSTVLAITTMNVSFRRL